MVKVKRNCSVSKSILVTLVAEPVLRTGASDLADVNLRNVRDNGR